MQGILLLVLVFTPVQHVLGLPDQGKWDFTVKKPDWYIGISKSLYKGSDIIIRIGCNINANITVGWMLRQTPCWNEYISIEGEAGPQSNLSYYYNNPWYLPNPAVYNETWYYRWSEETMACDTAVLPEVKWQPEKGVVSTSTASPTKATGKPAQPAKTEKVEILPTPLPRFSQVDKRSVPVVRSAEPHRQFSVPSDGIYLLVVHVRAEDPWSKSDEYSISLHVEMSADYGYLSAADWPYLPFYSVMCAVYVLYGLGWLLVCARQWRELLRIQFWIGAVIAFGMLEKAVFLSEYESINRSGHSVWGAVVFAELVSCAKRALARILVIIVSVGFGITKPRLGPLLHRVIALGLIFFIFASIESCTRALRPRNDLSGATLGTSVVLALLDSGICWWVFTALISTTRQLRLRRNEVKLTLYRHFTNTLILAVIASIGFMVWSVKFHKSASLNCLREWKNLWADEGCWHILFSIILLVIMLLWRPTNNNQRYAFTPLLDAGDEDEEDELFRSDAYSDVKMRARNHSSPSNSRRARNDSDDDLRWVEENIPSSMTDTALPVMDSDEEVMTTKFEVNKMQ